MRLVVKILNFDDIRKQCEKRIRELLSKPNGVIINDKRRFDENSEPPENYVAPKRKPDQNKKFKKIKRDIIKEAMLEEAIRSFKKDAFAVQRSDIESINGFHGVKPSIPEGRLEIISEDEITNLKISLARNEDLSKL